MQSPDMHPKNRRLLAIGFICFAVFVIFSLFEEFGLLSSFDIYLTRFFQNMVPRSLDTFLSFFSLAGSIETTTVILIILGIFLFKREKLVPYSLALFGLIMVIELIGKLHIYHPGPPKEFFRYALPFTTPHYVASMYSFPSGHMARTVFIAVVTALLAIKYIHNQNIRFILLISISLFLVLMFISRIYLGEHWASDCLGGLFLGSAFAFLAMVYYPKR